MITQQALEAAGFRKFTQKNLSQYTNTAWQKCIRDDNGKKYYITIAEYDNSDYPDIAKNIGRYSYQPDTQFEANGVTFDIQMHRPESVESMLEFFESMWQKMNCDYYEMY